MREHRDMLDAIAQELIQNESVEGEALERFFQGLPPEPPTTATPPTPAPAAPPTSTPAPPPQPRFIPSGDEQLASSIGFEAPPARAPFCVPRRYGRICPGVPT